MNEQIVGNLGIRIVPVFDQFGSQLQAGLQPFSGQSMGGGVAGSSARMAASGSALSTMTGSMAASATAQATSQTMARAAMAGDWTAHGAAADAMSAMIMGAAQSSGSANASPMSFYTSQGFAGGRSGGSPYGIGAHRADVRTSFSGQAFNGSLSASGEAEVQRIVKQEVAAHERYLSAINRAASIMEETAQSGRLSLSYKSNAPATAWGPDWGAGDVEAAANSRARPSKSSGKGFHLPNSARMVMFNAMFGGWEASQAMGAVDSGNFNALMAGSQSDALRARIQQQEQAWAGPFASMIATGMNAFGAGPLPFLRQARPTLAYADETEQLRQLGVSGQFDPSIRNAMRRGDAETLQRTQILQTRAVGVSTLQEQLNKVQGDLSATRTEQYIGYSNNQYGDPEAGGREVQTRTVNIAQGGERQALEAKKKVLIQQIKNLNDDVGAQLDALTHEVSVTRAEIRGQGRAAYARAVGDPNASIMGLDSSTAAAIGRNPENSDVIMGAAGGALMGILGSDPFIMRADSMMFRGRQANPRSTRVGDYYESMMGNQAEIASLQATLNRDQIGASRAINENQKRIELEAARNITDPATSVARISEIYKKYGLMDDVNVQQRDNSRKMIVIGTESESAQLSQLWNRNQVGAEAAGIVGSARSRIESLFQSGNGDLGRGVAENAISKLGLARRDYLDTFRADSVDTRGMDITNRRDQENPSVVLHSIDENIQKMTEALTNLSD